MEINENTEITEITELTEGELKGVCPPMAMLPLEYLDDYDMLTDEQFGKILRSVLEYISDGVIPDFESEPLMKMAWKQMKGTADRNIQKYRKGYKKRRDAGVRGAVAKWKKDRLEMVKDFLHRNLDQAEYEAFKDWEMSDEILEYVIERMKKRNETPEFMRLQTTENAVKKFKINSVEEYERALNNGIFQQMYNEYR